MIDPKDVRARLDQYKVDLANAQEYGLLDEEIEVELKTKIYELEQILKLDKPNLELDRP